MPPYINGLVFGLIFIFSFGPGFFSLIQTSVQKGLRQAIFLAFGISLSDIAYVSLALMGVSSLLEKEHVKFWIAVGGASVLIAYGIYSWFKKPRIYRTNGDAKFDRSYLKYLLKGFVLNGLNPFILIFWIGIISFVAVNHDYGTTHQVYFFSGVLTTIICTDISKAMLANRLRNVITPRFILIMNRSVGVILILFAVRIIFYLFEQNGALEINLP